MEAIVFKDSLRDKTGADIRHAPVRLKIHLHCAHTRRVVITQTLASDLRGAVEFHNNSDDFTRIIDQSCNK